jgi:hypothetical protein
LIGFCLFIRHIQLSGGNPKLKTAEDVLNSLPEYIESITDNFLDLATILDSTPNHQRKKYKSYDEKYE